MEKRGKLEGIRGWLILPMLGFIMGAIYNPYLLYSYLNLNVVRSINFWINLSSLAIISFLYIYGLVLLFKKKKLFPKWAIITLVIGAIYTITLAIILKNYLNVLGSIATLAIWTAYFLKSVRVKNTFVK